MDFPILDLLDEQASHAFPVDGLRPQGLRCPVCRGSRYATHPGRPDPVLDYRCADNCEQKTAWPKGARHERSASHHLPGPAR